VKLLSDNLNVCDHNPATLDTLQTDRQTDGRTDDILIAIPR